MRILVCAAAAPVPPVNGFRLQLIHLCRELADRHELCVLGYGPGDETDVPPGIELRMLPAPATAGVPRAVATVRGVLTRTPRRAVSLTPAMARSVRELRSQRKFDVAHVAGPPLARVAREFAGLPAVLSTLDAWHLNAAASVNVASPLLRPLYRFERRTVERFGRQAYRPYERVVVVSEGDAQALERLDPSLRLEVIPNGVDSEFLAPNPEVPRERELVVFTGAMQWPPNAEAAVFLAREVLPLLRRRRPRVRLAIVGRNPGPQVRELSGLEGVSVTGEVPDMRPWLWRAGAFACPMVSGTGIKNKLLEALACEAPSVVTPLSCQGLRIVPGNDLLVASTAEEFAASLAGVLDDPELGDRLGRAGRMAVVGHHSWASVARAYEATYEEITRGHLSREPRGSAFGPREGGE